MNAINRQSRLHFVHCLKPRPTIMPNMALNRNGLSNSIKSNNIGRKNIYGDADVLDISYIRQQIRPIFFIDSVRANSRGMNFKHFIWFVLFN